MAIAPARRNEIHTAAPATSPAAPSNEKIPAPTIAPTPMNAAWRTSRRAPVETTSADIVDAPFPSIVDRPVAPSSRTGRSRVRMWAALTHHAHVLLCIAAEVLRPPTDVR